MFSGGHRTRTDPPYTWDKFMQPCETGVIVSKRESAGTAPVHMRMRSAIPAIWPLFRWLQHAIGTHHLGGKDPGNDMALRIG